MTGHQSQSLKLNVIANENAVIGAQLGVVSLGVAACGASSTSYLFSYSPNRSNLAVKENIQDNNRQQSEQL